jgi:hypothetical protein
MEDTQLSIVQALETDVLVQKGISELVLHIHHNMAPDFEWMEVKIAMIVRLIDHWLQLRLLAEGKPESLGELSVAYFANAGMDQIPAALARILSKVRNKVSAGVTPAFKDDAVQYLGYDSKIYHNAETWALAGALGVSLE